jgi:hypothetical protein
MQRLFKAYFTDGLNVGDHAALADLAEQTGIDRVAVMETLDGGAFGDRPRTLVRRSSSAAPGSRSSSSLASKPSPGAARRGVPRGAEHDLG